MWFSEIVSSTDVLIAGNLRRPESHWTQHEFGGFLFVLNYFESNLSSPQVLYYILDHFGPICSLRFAKYFWDLLRHFLILLCC